VGPANQNALNAATNDYYCGYYRFYNNGNDMGYCNLAKQYAASAGIQTVATVICGAGTYYNYQAGLNHYYCRYYEYIGLGWNYGNNCAAATSFAQAGACNCGGTGGGPSCTANPPVGANNSNAYNAGLYDYYCGFIKYYNGNDYGNCAVATNYARAAGIKTVATGSCAAGAYYAYCPHRGRDAAEKANHEREAERAHQDPRRELEPEHDFRERVHVHGGEGGELHRQPAQDAEQAAGEGEQQRLAEEPDQDGAAAKSERAQHPDLAHARGYLCVHRDQRRWSRPG
jgi:hypothetical protein